MIQKYLLKTEADYSFVTDTLHYVTYENKM